MFRLSRLLAVMSSRQPHGRFLAREDTGWTALDNTTGDAWTEHFQHRRVCAPMALPLPSVSLGYASVRPAKSVSIESIFHIWNVSWTKAALLRHTYNLFDVQVHFPLLYQGQRPADIVTGRWPYFLCIAVILAIVGNGDRVCGENACPAWPEAPHARTRAHLPGKGWPCGPPLPAPRCDIPPVPGCFPR